MKIILALSCCAIFGASFSTSYISTDFIINRISNGESISEVRELKSKDSKTSYWQTEKMGDPISGEYYRVQTDVLSPQGNSIGFAGFIFPKNKEDNQFLIDYGDAHICSESDNSIYVTYNPNYKNNNKIGVYGFKVASNNKWLISKKAITVLNEYHSQKVDDLVKILSKGDTYFRVNDECGQSTDFIIKSEGLNEALIEARQEDFGKAVH